MRSLAALGLLLLVAPACRTSVPPEPTRSLDRLAVVTEEGDILTIGPGREDPLSLTDDAAPERTYRQPTWSPDGERLAWAAVERGEGLAGALLTARPDGGDRTEAATDFPPFYLSWRPDGRAVAYLSNSHAEGIELGLVDLDPPGRARVLAGGQPFYLAWSPDGERLLTHVGTEELSLLTADGDSRAVGPRPGLFQAPAWGPGERLVYAIRDDGDQRLVVADPEGRIDREVRRYRGPARFVLSPDGNRLAYQVGGARPPGQGLPAGLAQQQPSGPGPVRVVDLETGEEETAFDGISLAFFWSPDGSALLILAGEVDERGEPWLRWHVGRGGTTRSFERFRPSTMLGRDYLPFFDQYAQSVSFWAPDGGAFVYAGRHDSGTSGVWVQELAEGAAPRLVTEGVFAAWSPG